MPPCIYIIGHTRKFPTIQYIAIIMCMYPVQPDPSQHRFEAVAIYNYSSRTVDMNNLPLTKGEKVTILDTSEGDWWFARNQLG